MPAAKPKAPVPPFDASKGLLEAFAINDRINQFLLGNLAEAAWRAVPPTGKGRTVAAIVAHMHNVRVMWLKMAAKGSKIPDQLVKEKVTPAQGSKALVESGEAITRLLQTSLDSDGRIKSFRPHVAPFVGYLIAHDAHHRGQITMLARQAGHPIDQKTMFGMWEWGVR